MATRSIRVEFVADEAEAGLTAPNQVHDVSIDDSSPDVPEVLENPHVDFPGVWRLVGDGEGGAYRYAKAAEVADTSNTLAV